MLSQALPVSFDQKALEVYGTVMGHVEAILCTHHADSAVINR